MFCIISVKRFTCDDPKQSKLELTCTQGTDECSTIDIYGELISKFISEKPNNLNCTTKNIIDCLFLPDDQITIKYNKLRSSNHLKATDITSFHRPFTLNTFQALFNDVTKIHGIGPKTIEKHFNEHLQNIKITNEKLIPWIDLAKLTPTLIADPIKAKFHLFLNSRPDIKNKITDSETITLLDKFRSLLKKHHNELPSIDSIIYLLCNIPYRILEYSKNIKHKYFTIYDKIATQSLNIPLDNPYRISSGLMCFMFEFIYKEGHTYHDYDTFVDKVFNKLQLNDHIEGKIQTSNYLKKYCASLNGEKIVIEPKLKEAENKIAEAIQKLINLGESPQINETIHSNSNYSEEQLDAISSINCQPISILNGPPGAGKTHVQDAIYNYHLENKEQIIFSAPTGIATKNIANALNSSPFHIYTVQKLITYITQSDAVNQSDNNMITFFEKLVSNGCPCEFPITCLVVDEFSMVDTIQFSTLITIAARFCLKVILVGDINQLPSIGPGKVLRDLIQSHKIPVNRLTKVFRQKSLTISQNAKKINEGQTLLVTDASFFLKHLKDDQTTLDYLKKTVNQMKTCPINFGLTNFDITTELLVLTPYSKYNNPLSALQLNRQLATIFNNLHNIDICTNFIPILPGDRVIYTKNDTPLGVVNGDIGFIECIDKDNYYINLDKWTRSSSPIKQGDVIVHRGKTKVEPFKVLEIIDDNALCGLVGSNLEKDDENTYAIKELLAISELTRTIAIPTDDKHLQHAYAVTVHKAQGTGIRVVILVLPNNYNTFLVNRELVYTAITRAKDMVIVLGDNIERAIKVKAKARNTLLPHRLKK